MEEIKKISSIEDVYRLFGLEPDASFDNLKEAIKKPVTLELGDEKITVRLKIPTTSEVLDFSAVDPTFGVIPLWIEEVTVQGETYSGKDQIMSALSRVSFSLFAKLTELVAFLGQALFENVVVKVEAQ